MRKSLLLALLFLVSAGSVYGQQHNEILGTYKNLSGLIETYKMKEMRIEDAGDGSYNIVFYGPRKRMHFSARKLKQGKFVWKKNGFPFKIRFKNNVAFVENLSRSVFERVED